MRVFLVTGPLITRLKELKFRFQWMCNWFKTYRPSYKRISSFGVQVSMHSGYAKLGRINYTGEIYLDFPSVGATENIMMLASVIPGDTVIANAAREPEVTDLANFLMAMGAKIDGVGTDTIIIHGTPKLYGCDYSIINDRIEAGTFCVAAAITGGNVEVKGVNHIAMRSILPNWKKSVPKFPKYRKIAYLFL